MNHTQILQPESLAALARIPKGCINEQSAKLGVTCGEPILYALDGLLRYAKAYEKRYEAKLATDGVLGDYWLDAIKGLHGLLNGDGAVALELNRSTDSKDNGACETIYWAALDAAGFKNEDL